MTVLISSAKYVNFVTGLFLRHSCNSWHVGKTENIVVGHYNVMVELVDYTVLLSKFDV